MVSFLIPFLILLLQAFALSLLFKRTLVETFPVAVFSTILCLYAGGLLRNLRIGLLLTVLLAAALWMLCWKRKLLMRYQLKCHQQEWLRSLWVLLPALAVVLIFTAGLELSFYDEYTHWGLAVKEMYLRQELYCAPQSATDFKDYVPGAALIEYFFCVFGTFKSANLFRGLDVLLVAALSPMFKNAVRSNGSLLHIPVGWTAVILLLYGNYSDVFTLLQVDAALAILFASLMLFWFGDEKKDNFTILSVSLNAVALTLTKGSGIALTVLGLIVVGIDVWLHRKEHSSEWKAPLVAVGSAVAVWLSWRGCTTLYGVSATRSQGSGMLSSLRLLLQGKWENYQIETLSNFFSSYVGNGVVDGVRNSISYFEWIFYLVLFAVFVALLRKDKKQGWLLIFAAPMVHIVYSAMLLLTYILSFGSVEGVQLASLYRYMPSGYLAMLLLLLGCLLQQTAEIRTNDSPTIRQVRICLPLVVLSVTALLLPCNYLLYEVLPSGPHSPAAAQKLVQPYMSLRELANNVPTDTTVLLLGNTEEKGFYTEGALISQYELLPVSCDVLQQESWQSEEQLKESLFQADYLFILPQETPFTEQQQALLPQEIVPEGGLLYKVNAEQGSFSLVEK